MAYGLTLLTPPANEPVTTDEAKQWLRQGQPEDSKLIDSLVRDARQLIESNYGMQMVTATWKMSVDRFPRYSQLGGLQYSSEALWAQRIPMTELAGRYWPDRACFRIPRSPLQAVSQIQYVDGATGNLLVLDPSQYNVDTANRPGRIAPVPGGIWPIIQQQLDAVQITFLAGYGPPPAVPETLKRAIKVQVAFSYINRTSGEMAPGVDALIQSEWSGEYP